MPSIADISPMMPDHSAPADHAVWTLRLLGDFRIAGANGDVVLSARKAVAMLAYLALQRDRLARRDTLANLLWDSVDTAQARVSLRQAIAAVRRLEGDGPPILLADADVVRLADAMTSDVETFDRLAQGGTIEQRAAADLYHGDLLAGFALRDAPGFNEWLAIAQAQWRQRAVAVLIAIVDAALDGDDTAGGDTNAGVTAALRLLSIDPFNEAAHRALMRLYARQGRAALALAQYRTLSNLLRTELQVTPDAQTQALFEQLRGARREPVAPSPPMIRRPTSAPEAPAPMEPTGADPPPPLPEPLAAPRRRRWRGLALSVLAVTAVALGAFVVTEHFADAPPEVDRLLQLTPPGENVLYPTLSPDGRQLAYVRTQAGNQDIRLIATTGDGEPQSVVRDEGQESSPVWKPDGSALLFTRTTAAGCTMVLKGMPAGGERVVGPCPGDVFAASWLGNGDRVLIARGTADPHSLSEIATYDLATGRTSPLPGPPPDGPNIFGQGSPDGTSALLIRVRGYLSSQLIERTLADGTERVLTDAGGMVRGAAWLGDDRGIVFLSERSGDYSLWWLPRGGGAARRLSAGLTEYQDMTASADGHRLALLTMQAQNRFAMLPPGAGPQTAVTPLPGFVRTSGDSFPDHARDGSIAFVSRRSGQEQIWVKRPDSAAQQLTRTDGWRYLRPRWSPDGRFIAVSANKAGSGSLYLIDARTAQVMRVTRGIPTAGIAWRTNRYLYAVARQPLGTLIRIDLETRRFTRTRIADVRKIDVSADGSALYFSRDLTPGIFRMALSPDGIPTGPPQPVVPRYMQDNNAQWFVQGRDIVYTTRNGKEAQVLVHRQDLTTGTDRIVGRDIALNWTATLAAAPNGGIIVDTVDVENTISLMTLR